MQTTRVIINRCTVNPWCKVDEPFLTSFRGLATYTVPKIDVQVSGTWRSDPGHELRADYVVTNAIAQPSLGRDSLRAMSRSTWFRAGTLYGERINNIDLRIAKILRFGQTRTQFGVDLYNLLNSDAVTHVQQRIFADRRMAHADRDPTRALRAAEPATRLLIGGGGQ